MKCNAILRNDHSLRSATRFEACVSKCLCPLSPKHLSIAAAIDPSVHSRPTNRESSILSPFRHGGKRRERWIPLEERKIGSFAPSTSHAYASITNHSRGKVNFFLGRRKSVSKDDDDQFYRRHFNRKFGLREPLPRAKIRACLFPNCHRGRVERKGMEEGIDTGEFKSLRREKGIWFGDLNRVEFLAVGQVFFLFF